MEKYVPLSKKSKKEQKKFHSMQRNTGCVALNPVTQIVPNGKAYNRNKQKQEDRRKGRDFRYEGPAFFYA